jgi:hypothetical protein
VYRESDSLVKLFNREVAQEVQRLLLSVENKQTPLV